jgi:ribosomal protein S20
MWEDKNIVDNEKRVERFFDIYKNVDKYADKETIKKNPNDPLL